MELTRPCSHAPVAALFPARVGQAKERAASLEPHYDDGRQQTWHDEQIKHLKRTYGDRNGMNRDGLNMSPYDMTYDNVPTDKANKRTHDGTRTEWRDQQKKMARDKTEAEIILEKQKLRQHGELYTAHTANQWQSRDIATPTQGINPNQLRYRQQQLQREWQELNGGVDAARRSPPQL